jgi:predicted metal-dependent peptidase
VLFCLPLVSFFEEVGVVEVSGALKERLTGSKIRLLRNVPFFGTLLVHAEYVESSDVPLAATDGRRVILNPVSLLELKVPEFDFVILHEVMHCALRHVSRLAGRNPLVWNIATDAIINESIVGTPGTSMLDGLVTNKSLASLLPAGKLAAEYSAEELYALLLQAGEKELRRCGGSGGLGAGEFQDLMPDGGGEGKDNAVDGHWRRALASAKHAQERFERSPTRGVTPAGVKRLMDVEFGLPVVDWRQVLWQFLSAFPSDYGGFDRRLIHSGSYLRTLDGEVLTVHACVDTSGSVDDGLLRSFFAEVRGILGVHTHVKLLLYFADAELHGPFEVGSGDFPNPVGGGGTDFRPFFEFVERESDLGSSRVLVYLTDGFGSFPSVAPSDSVLWCVTPGGLGSEGFPFGEVVRLLD